ncbi:TasA family protein [Ornithinibacillus halotolerans]|uniref:LPXTG cell wall anchor domain-containing protein n=1 Tax=Ornithinibacillus halotolerans TaxID=1274357 RepID=A0A916RRM5_9BACI|nr:TasA family protein [Ornithinibacillus halotolerans]GGA67070.1 hypothetical protein GCM10008025_08610 [Ornithinibacillus halotolerans]
MKRLLLVCILSISIIVVVFSPKHSLADSAEGKHDIDISLSPSDVLFDLKNMKPGDWAPRTLTVNNKGKLDFEYQMSITNEGDYMLFNELVLEVADGNNELWNGKLKDFNGLSNRSLKANESEDLEFTLRFPEELGNEFQGKEVHFKLVFVAEGKEEGQDDTENPGDDPSDSEDPDDEGGVKGIDKETNDKDTESVDGIVNDGDSSGGSTLPNTAANMFNYIFIGAYLLIIGGLIFLISLKRKRSKVSEI